MNPIRTAAVFIVAATAAGAPALAQGFRDVEIRTIKVVDGVYMLMGRGGNIGLSVGEDGVFMIDDQFAPLTGKITAAIGELTDQPVRFLVNTHWHGDHTGGNENLGQAGAIIVAHENVRKRMSTEQFMEAFDRTTPASPPEALPVITFTGNVTFHWNGDELRVVHVDLAHTDGDSIIHFRRANVLHLGDTYFNGMYPFIDVSSGGTMNGMIAAVDRALELVDDETKVIPGHGELSDGRGLREYRRLLTTVRDRVQRLRAEGKSREQVVAAAPTREFDERWGGGFLGPDQWVAIVYDSMQERRGD